VSLINVIKSFKNIFMARPSYSGLINTFLKQFFLSFGTNNAVCPVRNLILFLKSLGGKRLSCPFTCCWPWSTESEAASNKTGIILHRQVESNWEKAAMTIAVIVWPEFTWYDWGKPRILQSGSKRKCKHYDRIFKCPPKPFFSTKFWWQSHDVIAITTNVEEMSPITD
jgi:hypothetical protein